MVELRELDTAKAMLKQTQVRKQAGNPPSRTQVISASQPLTAAVDSKACQS